MPYKVGDKVRKWSGDYRFDGTVVAVFTKLNGAVRFVVENGDGILHIFSESNLAPPPSKTKILTLVAEQAIPAGHYVKEDADGERLVKKEGT